MNTEFLQKLSHAFGPPSLETEVADLLENELKNCGFSCRRDRSGNLFCPVTVCENAPRVALCAHMDEVGFMLTEAEDGGFWRFEPLGRIDPRVLTGRFVMLGNEKTRVRGLTAAKGIHLQNKSERSAIPEADELYIDIGAKDRDEAEKELAPGDLGVFDTPFGVMGEEGRYFRGKALDGRVGCAMLAGLAKRLAALPEKIDLTLVFLTRQEAVPAGVSAALSALAPQVAVFVDAVEAKDASEEPSGALLGGGAVLPVADGRLYYDRALHTMALRVASEKRIPCTVPVGASSGIDVAALYRGGAAVRSLCFGYPLRYAKTPNSVGMFADISALENLLEAFLLQLAKGGI